MRAHPRTPAQRARDAAQARTRRARRNLEREPILFAPAISAILDVTDCHVTDRVSFGSRPTDRELMSLAEIAQHGSLAEAAVCMGISYHTTRNVLCDLYKRIGAVGAYHAMYQLGWVCLPGRYRKPH